MEGGIFEGLKVLDCASFIAAPAAATVLSDFGAEVIKIEPPGSGDPYRNLPNLPGYPHQSAQFRLAAGIPQQTKPCARSLQAGRPGGAASARGRGRRLHHQFSARRCAARLGMTYAGLAPLNARLIYASFTGYGEKGEEANKPGFDSNAYWARSGLMDLVRADDHDDAGALGRRHGRPPLRDGAVRRDRHRALQARTHRQGLACQFEPDGQRRLGQRRARPGQIMRREIQRAAHRANAR